MTPSTTNTAARELLASALDECGRPTDAAEVREGRNPFVRGEYALAAIEKSLTQQQGGEQEAGVAVIVGELTSFVAHIATCHSNLDGTVTLPASVKASAINITERCNMTELVYTALRTKQPAASEGDVVRSAQHVKNIATMPNEIRSAILEALAAYDPERMARCGNTSKQAAGEAVAWGQFEDGRLVGLAFQRNEAGECTTPLYTTPPRHPADEGAVDDSMVERAADAYEAAAESEGFGRVEGSERVTHLRFIRAAIAAALQAGTP